MDKFKQFFQDWKYIYQNDPIKKCQLYLNEGCSHVDGYLCDFPECSMNLKYLASQK